MSIVKVQQASQNPIEVLFRGARKMFFIVGFFSLFVNLLMLVGPLYMMQVYDRVLLSQSIDTLAFLTIAAVFLILIGALLEYLRMVILNRMAAGLDLKLTNPMFGQLLSKSLVTRTSGRAQPLRDMDTLRSFLGGNGLIVFFDAPWTPVFIFFIFLMHPVLGTVALAGAIILFVLAMFSEFLTRKPLKTASGHGILATNFAESSLRNAEVIEAMGMLEGIKKRWAEHHHKSLALQAEASDKGAGVKGAIKFVRPVLQVAMLGIGAFLVVQQELTPGVMIAASIIMGRALAPVEMAVGNWRNVVLARSAYGRLHGFLEDWQERKTMPLPRPKGALDVERVVAAAPGSKKPLIKNVSFSVNAGEAIGIIGPSAAGKSTMARLLVGVWRPASGHVRLDGVDIANWDHEELGPHLGYLPQDVELFDGTIAENIARFTEPDPEAVVEAAQLAGVHDMILRFEDGYDTRIGEGGANLSGGQRQRLGLARAVYKTPALVVLDEPNANLDGEGEQALKKAMTTLKAQGTTLVVVAHRPSIVQVLDKLLVIKDGAVDEFGPIDEVLPKVTRRRKPGVDIGQRQIQPVA